MSMINIIVYACLLSDPTACEDKIIPIADQGSLNACMFLAQPYIAEWSVSHPKYKILKWRCGYAGVGEQPI